MYIVHSEKIREPFILLNHIIFHWDQRQRTKSFGSLNPDLRFFVLISDNMDCGLLASYSDIVRKIHRCIRRGFVPIVDWQNYKTQYNVDFPVNGTRNAWEYYFEQPTTHTLDEVYRSKNVRLSGWTLPRPRGLFIPNATKSHKIKFELSYEELSIAPIKKYIRDIADEKIRTYGIDDMIGVLARGTDYAKLKPAGHPIPPSPEMISAKADEFMKKYGRRRIFLATEDANIYEYFTARYGELIFTTDNNLIKNYSASDYIASQIKAVNKYQFGLDYLVKMLCLSRCKYLVAAKTAGSSFARIMNRGQYVEEYVFDLGTY